MSHHPKTPSVIGSSSGYALVQTTSPSFLPQATNKIFTSQGDTSTFQPIRKVLILSLPSIVSPQYSPTTFPSNIRFLCPGRVQWGVERQGRITVCVNGDSSYDDRKAARAKEIEALQKAQVILQEAFKEKAGKKFMQISKH